jgi:hypothetical protein
MKIYFFGYLKGGLKAIGYHVASFQVDLQL